MIFGFEENYSTKQIIVALTFAVQRGFEWHHCSPVTVLSADVKSAFDFLTIDSIIDSSIYWSFPTDLVGAMVEETLNLEGNGFLQGVCTPQKFNFKRCVKQGGMESPW